MLQATDWPVLCALIAAHLHLPRELVGADLLPSFQVFMSEQFEAHIYSPRIPYRPRAAGITLLSQSWPGAAAVGSYWSESKEEVSQTLNEAATRDVLLADQLQDDKDGTWHMNSNWPERYGVKDCSSEDRFQAVFETMWVPLWA